jgi:hypothetical protein
MTKLQKLPGIHSVAIFGGGRKIKKRAAADQE